MAARPPAVIVLDIGKTHVKLFAIEPEGGAVLAERQTSHQSLEMGPYRHVDVGQSGRWLIRLLKKLASEVEIKAIIPSSYGSTAALIDDYGLVLPMMDYEVEPPADVVEGYARIAPPFDEVCCPVNPACLTLARQLFWQSRHFPDAFECARWILPAAQYWAWRLTGKVAMEITSLGAQTQLWNPRRGAVTDLAVREGWAGRFPPLRRAFDELGPVLPELVRRMDLDRVPPVLVGIHDSNANYARYLAAGLGRFTLISSGTWLITFDTDLSLDRLDPERDMVANTDLLGRPVACTRFMGGREFAEIAGEDGMDADPDPADLQRLIDQATMALPAFSDSGGPFPAQGHRGRIEGPAPGTPREKAALAALYTALVTDIDLDLLNAADDIIVDGSFADNPLYTSLLAAFRPGQRVMISMARNGTALGASLLWGWSSRQAPIPIELAPAPELALQGLAQYRAQWRQKTAAR